ncbi:MAG: hypothetical protein M1147_06490 [Nitrospirae bacterium]|nr:hypothetical protein [Nitrospirota bacterium]MCL5977760.1 hypothetical protein [Nitrospirota bacterium]
MRVAMAFQTHKFIVTLSSYYKDSDENKYREIDIIVSRNLYFQQSPLLFIDLTYVIECKYSPDKPWILLQSMADNDSGISHDIDKRIATTMGKLALLELSLDNDARNNKIFTFDNRLSYGVTRAFENHSDMPYKALFSVCKAANSRAIEIDKLWNNKTTSKIEFIFPLVIVDGQLYDCNLGNDNDIILNNVSKGTVIFRNPSIGDNLSFVEIVTEQGLEDFIKIINSEADILQNCIRHNLPKTKERIEIEQMS